jgi:hypothetical protein
MSISAKRLSSFGTAMSSSYSFDEGCQADSLTDWAADECCNTAVVVRSIVRRQVALAVQDVSRTKAGLRLD